MKLRYLEDPYTGSQKLPPESVIPGAGLWNFPPPLYKGPLMKDPGKLRLFLFGGATEVNWGMYLEDPFTGSQKLPPKSGTGLWNFHPPLYKWLSGKDPGELRLSVYWGN